MTGSGPATTPAKSAEHVRAESSWLDASLVANVRGWDRPCVGHRFRRFLRPIHAEEASPVPLRPGDGPSDVGETAIGLVLPGEADLQHHDPMHATRPFANEHGPGLDARARRGRSGTGSPVFALPTPQRSVPSRKAIQHAQDLRVEVAQCVRLNAIG